MDNLTTLFPDVADAMGIETIAIVEKDYYIVELLRLIQTLTFETHQLVFGGGTALSKAGIGLNRMSEDVDIKLVPTTMFLQNNVKNQCKNIRRNIIQTLKQRVASSALFSFEDQYPDIINDVYRYNQISVKYPQAYFQVPFLRPFIKLELVESNLLEEAQMRDISSLVTDIAKQGNIISAFPCVSILSTQAEKLVSMLRRTAAAVRDPLRDKDESLVRHIYDNFCIVREKESNATVLAHLVKSCIEQDKQHYGHQHRQFLASPVEELLMGLQSLKENPIHRDRYDRFVQPMVFGDTQISWDEAYQCFYETTVKVLT